MNSIQHLIEIALKEDIGPGDITTDNLIDPNLEGKGILIAKEPLVVAGLEIVARVFRHLDPDVLLNSEYTDGDTVEPGDTIADVQGKLRALLSGERTALNFLQRLSGVATFVRAHVNELAGKKSRLVDTRKTTPGWRVLEKYAVRVGGAHNHRMGLYDGVLIKDNHIVACGGIKQAVDRIRADVSHLSKIEVEVSSMKQVADQIKDAIAHIDGRAVVEVSGNVKKSVLKSLADTGADIISAGALTHSARCVDISMRIKAADELL